ncbi:hypothetical protein TBR22_A41740 [Luteitalea sp. TBR-22]|uniref:DUF2950 family protein n=1 Tax=Luteitalea sp. TBR-22 TaxID=2802971 RepID=UPI001AFACAB4|nr:DUF2950 family protein [Luteitalea sp. TBR-22]BCS34948.1 hypothetical protein TBR22_A41740 [Luteitalea sp. TBR-22]
MTPNALMRVACALAVILPAAAGAQPPRAFPTPEEAVAALAVAARADDITPLLGLLGGAGRDLAASSDAATARQNRDVFLAAMAEGWRLERPADDRRELVVGREAWPFPVPIVKTGAGWVFDAEAGKEEVLTRRIGRNELAAIRIVHAYVTAQRAYARRGHDGRPAGLYARRVASSRGMQDGLYWPAAPGQPRSPLGELAAAAAAEGRPVGNAETGPVPFYGYHFRILEKQGPKASGGAKSYVVDGVMSGGFALVAWPARYGETGITTFIVNQDGVVYEKDLGLDTAAAAPAITAFDPDATWQRVVAADSAR